MGERTHGGKGDKSRVTDRETFWDNYDKIFRKEEGKESYPQLHELVKEEEPIDIDRILREWGMMYDCLQNIHLYEYPVEEARQLLKQIKTS